MWISKVLCIDHLVSGIVLGSIIMVYECSYGKIHAKINTGNFFTIKKHFLKIICIFDCRISQKINAIANY